MRGLQAVRKEAEHGAERPMKIFWAWPPRFPLFSKRDVSIAVFVF